MRNKLFIMLVVVVLIFSGQAIIYAGGSCGSGCGGGCGGSSCGGDSCGSSCGTSSCESEDEGVMTGKVMEAVSPAIEIANKLCPVSGGEVGAMGPIVKHEYNGEIYNLCCAGCIETFNEDPEKYVEKIKETLLDVPMGDSCGGTQSCHG